MDGKLVACIDVFVVIFFFMIKWKLFSFSFSFSVKNQHLWEFIYETLLNPLYNPQYLRWENQREGVFRFVQSEAVAQLWGSRKNNENMTYEKLSRAMRYEHFYFQMHPLR